LDEQRLRSLPLFSSLSKQELREVTSHADEVEVGEGKQLISQGEFAYELFVIEAGTAQVLHDGKWVAELGPGDFMGEMGVLDSERRRSATVIATSPMKLIVMTGRDFREINRKMPSVAHQIRAKVEERSRALAG
jgi:CRP/FNR family transcriptional regulator, cyclic AMP receptor protein